MEKKMSKMSLFVCFSVSLLVSHTNLVTLVMCSSRNFGDQKTYYPSPADPHTGTPPSGSSHGSSPTPSHGSSGGSPPSSSGGNCGTPPTHHHRSHHGSPPSYTTPSTPIVLSPPPPSTPSVDPGSGYSYPPPTSSGGSGGSSPPSTPVIVTPVTPSTPVPTINPPPLIPVDPNTPVTGGTCNYWKSHIPAIWGLIGGWWTSIGGILGVPSTSTSSFGPHMNLVEALSNTRTDGVGALYREGTTSLLNSMVSRKFTYSTQQVKDGFVAGLASNKAAAHHARIFKVANEGLAKPRP
ncbi:hypothetical protein GIB67_032568 [Kingdonia uniflora]|uniref:Protodermal factor 1 n=1 Tax=Kingdonia uniflora TaxID=39325 RepID=A0A7J7LS08_9MAGN|nr:hypothetical protein GIB67_032568 [Kingdonia uniflora]